MKKKLILLLAALMAAAMLAGCGAPEAQPTESVPETTAHVFVEPDLTQAPTIPLTEAPTETETPTEVPAPYEFSITPVITGEQTQVTVTTADEFLAAIAPNTEIVVDTPLIDLSTATGYGKVNGDYYEWREEHDGPGLYILGVSNLTIRGASEDHDDTVISCDPRYAHVLSFENCGNIWVKGITAGHSKEAGSCAGGVLAFISCQDILIEDCGLFGCGTWGVWGENSKQIQVADSEIYECSNSGMYLTWCRDIQIDGTTFRDLGEPGYPGSVFRIYDCENITFNGQKAPGFKTLEEMGLE